MKKWVTYVFLLCSALGAYAGNVVYESTLGTQEEFDQWLFVDVNEDSKT